MTLGKRLNIIKPDQMDWNAATGSGQSLSNNQFSSRFKDEFDIEFRLGQGGFGVVFEVKNKLDCCGYAVKRIKLTNDVSRVRVLREVKTMANFEHQNIVRYFQSWVENPPNGWQEEEDAKNLDDDYTEEYDETPEDEDVEMEPQNDLYLYIQMELCRRDTLKDWLRDNDRLQRFDYIGSIFNQIVDAVNYVHTSDLIHRDLKPCNIFFSREGRIKIGDFGLVTHMREKSHMITDCSNQDDGTQLYMAPEQLEGKPFNFKVDIYSMGIILFELLVYFSTEMERHKTLTSLRKAIYPDDFEEQYPKQFKLLNRMLSTAAKERPSINEIKLCAPEKSVNGHCLICAPKHALVDCRRFQAMNVFQRHNLVRKHDYCRNCLDKTHPTVQCPSADRCGHCGRKHHKLLHMLQHEMSRVNEIRRKRRFSKRSKQSPQQQQQQVAVAN